MKIPRASLVALTVFIVMVGLGSSVAAYDSSPYTDTTFSLSSNTIIAAASQPITATFHCYYLSDGHGCPEQIQLSGGTGSSALSWSPGLLQTDASSGIGTFTIYASGYQSTTTTAIIYAYDPDGTQELDITIQASNFSQTAKTYGSSSSNTHSGSTKTGKFSTNTSSQTADAQPSTNSAAPASPNLSSIKVGTGTRILGKTINLHTGQKLLLTGKTVPGGRVDLYIYSVPQKVTITADTMGVWSYAVTSLSVGSHHIEATVTDPNTNLVSERKTIAQMHVANSVTAKKTQTIRGSWLALPVTLIALCGLVLVDILWKPLLRKSAKTAYKKVRPASARHKPENETTLE